jgi:MoxR-like ATPase
VDKSSEGVATRMDAPPQSGDARAAGHVMLAGRSDGQRFRDALERAVGAAVVDLQLPLRLLAVALLADGHALIEDVPGTGKTTLARAFARALGLSFARVQGTPDLLPGDVTGSSVYEAGTFRFIPGPIFTNVLLVDEINRATPRTQSALLEAMQERQVSADGETRPLPAPFLVLATQNPIELEGTFSLPEAQLDRFLVRVDVGYPTEAAELQIAGRYQEAPDPLDRVTPVVDATGVLAFRDRVREVRLGDDVGRYLVNIVRASRSHPDVRLGGSPRASVALYRASQAWAWLEGRDFVLPDDVRVMVAPVLGHRLLLDVDRELRGASVQAAMSDLLDSVPVPIAEVS